MRCPLAQVFVSAAIIAPALGAPSPKPHRADAFDVYLRGVSKGTRNCGSTDESAIDRSTVDTCVMASIAAQEPFVARYNQRGVDSIVAKALYLSREKVLSIFYYDGPGSETNPCVQLMTCGSPRVIKLNNRIRVECTNVDDL